MKYLKLKGLLLLLILVVSCNTKEKKKANTVENELSEKMYSYTIDSTGVSVLWTAYKFTNKLGVSGTFDAFDLTVTNEVASIEDVLINADISIYTASVNSGDKIRDPKIRASFFKAFNTDTIKGTIVEASNGKGFIDLKMNNLTNQLTYSYALKSDTLVMQTQIDLEKWKGEQAIQSLNKECYDLHKGTDGISKLWPDVDVIIKLPIRKKMMQ